jgi:hypothetical protein
MRATVFGMSFIAAIAVIVAASVLYLVFYNVRINKQLRGEGAQPRRVPSPLAFSVVTAFVVMFAYIGITVFLALSDFGADIVPAEYRNAVYDYRAYNPGEMTGYLSLYSIAENPGYTKTVERHGDIRFTVFTENVPFDYYHPSFIVYAEYLGDKDILYRGVLGKFYAPDERQMSGKGSAGHEFGDYLCVIGTSSIQSRFELTVYLYDSALKGEELGDYAAAAETVTIRIPAPR